jgi:hypothetical protein
MVEMVTDGGEVPGAKRDFTQAQKTIVELHRSGGLNQEALARFAQDRKFEETVAAIAAISGLTIETVDQLVSGGKRDSMLILGRGLGLEWAVVRALLGVRLAPGRMLSATDVEDARVNFERLALPTAQRMMKFWKDRAQAS